MDQEKQNNDRSDDASILLFCVPVTVVDTPEGKSNKCKYYGYSCIHQHLLPINTYDVRVVVARSLI